MSISSEAESTIILNPFTPLLSRSEKWLAIIEKLQKEERTELDEDDLDKRWEKCQSSVNVSGIWKRATMNEQSEAHIEPFKKGLDGFEHLDMAQPKNHYWSLEENISNKSRFESSAIGGNLDHIKSRNKYWKCIQVNWEKQEHFTKLFEDILLVSKENSTEHSTTTRKRTFGDEKSNGEDSIGLQSDEAAAGSGKRLKLTDSSTL